MRIHSGAEKKGWRRILTNNITVVCIQLWPLFTEEGLPHSQHRRTGIQENERNTRETLVAKKKELKKAGKGNRTKTDRTPTDEEVDVLYGKELLGLSSAESLLNTLWSYNTQYFGLSIEIRDGAMFSFKPVRMERNFSNILRDKQK